MKKRIIAMIMSLVLCLSLNTVAFATTEGENNATTNSNYEVRPISEVEDFSREDALELLGITEEELGDGDLYVLDAVVTPKSGTIIVNSGDVFALPEFTFTGSNEGSTLLAFDTADRMKFGAAWKWLNPNSRTTAQLKVTMSAMLGAYTYTAMDSSGYGDGDENSFTTDWINVSSAYSYHFEYETSHGYYVESFPPCQIWIRMVIGAT